MKHTTLFLLLVLLGSGAWPAAAADSIEPFDWNDLARYEVYPRQVLVGYRGKTARSAVERLHSSLGAKVLHQYKTIPVQHVSLPARLSIEQAAAQYLADPNVLFVEPNFVVRATAIPDDPLYPDLWGMERIRAPEAWDRTTGSTNIVVAVIDSGILLEHEDLKDNLWRNPGETWNPDGTPIVNGVDDDGNGYVDDHYGWNFFAGNRNPDDDNGHGTHCAGTVGGVGNNTIGVAGVNWSVKLMALKFLGAGGSGSTAAAIEAVEYCTLMGVPLSNNSWGGGGASMALRLAIERAGREVNHLFVAAAGNSGTNNDSLPHYPSSYPLDNIIAVAAIDEAGGLASFSCYGKNSVHIGAPGVAILSCYIGAPVNQVYEELQGTSMACPHVAGAAALLWSLESTLSYSDIRSAILDGAAANSGLATKVSTGGELDLVGAMEQLKPKVILDRKAYRSDATVNVRVRDLAVDPLVPFVEVLAETLDPADTLRWSDTVTLPRLAGSIEFAGSFGLVSGTTAVEDDTLVVTYDNGLDDPVQAFAPIDDTPPVITAPQVVWASDDRALIRWLTDEPSDSRVIYSPAIPAGGLQPLPPVGSTDYVETPTEIDGAWYYVHEVLLSGLDMATLYYTAVLSSDYAGNEATYPADLTSEDDDDYLRVVTLHRRTAYENRMESGPAGWTVTNLHGAACWQYGVPSHGPVSAVTGTRLWGTVLDGNYPHLANASLIGLPVAVRKYPRMSFWSWHAIALTTDAGYIEVNDGTGWKNVTSQSGLGARLTGTSGGWQLIQAELPDFADTTMTPRFRLETDAAATAAGWYLDDFVVTHAQTPGVNIVGYLVDDAAGGDGDGFPEPGETFRLNLEVYNSLPVGALTGVTASVTIPTAGVTLKPATAAALYGDMKAGGRAWSGTQLVVTVSSGAATGLVFTVMHDATAAGGGLWPDTLRIEVVKRETISGTVTGLVTGLPIADALVWGRAAGAPDLVAVTAADGRYTLHGAIPGVTYEVWAGKPGEYSPSPSQFRTGPAIHVNFGLGTAYANAAPTNFVFNVEEGASASAGLLLDNTAGNLPLTFAFEADYLSGGDGWLSVAPSSGSVPNGSTSNLAVTANSAGLEPGAHEAQLRLTGNDLGNAPILLPVTLNVQAAPILYIEDVEVMAGGDDDPFVEPGEALDLNIILNNRGSQYALVPMGGLEYTGAGATTVTAPDALWLFVFPDEPADVFTPPSIAVDPAAQDGDVLPFALYLTNLYDAVTGFAVQVSSHTFALTVTVRRAISGAVYDVATTDPVPDAVVRAVSAQGVMTAVSDALGEYAIYGLEDGAYEVSVRPPAPYMAPPSSNVVIAAADAADVNFAVGPWAMAAVPTSITVTVPEGVETNRSLSIENGGPLDGFVELDIQLVEGMGAPVVGAAQFPAVDWAALKPGDYVPGELLVRYEDAAAAADQVSALGAVGALVMRTYSLVKAAHVRLPAGASLEQAARELEANPAVKYVEPNYLRKPYIAPNDPYYSYLYGLHNERQTGGTLDADINAPEAWDITVGRPEIVVAVIDTGVELTHGDLAANLVAGYDFGNDDPDPTPDYADPDGMPVEGAEHGTHVAGTVGAVGDNGIGVVGVGWNTAVMPLKASIVALDPLMLMPYAGLPDSATIAALEYAVTNGVKVSNHSYGGSYFSGIHYEAIRSAMSNDHLLVCAAGNESSNNDLYPSYPDSYNLPNIVSVAATDHDDQLADFSNYGATSVDLAAPGVDILSTYPLYNPMMGTVDDAYAWLDGTSMASPHVAGVAGLLRAIAPWATFDMLKQALLEGARPVPALSGRCLTGGRLDAAASLRRIQAFWLQLDPTSGNIPSGGALPIQVTLNAGGRLLAGTYKADIVARSGGNELAVPVTLNVTPSPVPALVGVKVEGGDGDGFPEPGETVNLRVTLRNTGSAVALSPTGTLASATPGVTILQGVSAWPAMAAGDAADNVTLFQVALPGAAGDVDFTLTITEPGRVPRVLSFTLDVRARRSITGLVTDAQTGAGLPGQPVEYWGAAGGRVVSGAGGAYRIDGLDDGAYSVRAIGTAHEKSAAAAVVIAGGDQAAHFALRQPQVTLTPAAVAVSAQGGQTKSVPLRVANGAAQAFQFNAIEMPHRRAALISDKTQLNGVGAVLEEMGIETASFVSNLVVTATGFSGRYSADSVALDPYDLVVLDLGADHGGGRLLSDAEKTALEGYLALGGKIILTGANLMTRPDDRHLRDLVGADSLDRLPDEEDAAELVAALPNAQFVGVSVGDRLAVEPLAYDLATPGAEASAWFDAGGAVKVLRRVPAAGGVVYLWAGNRDGAEWTARGVWQDVFRNLLIHELAEDVPWLTLTPASGAVSGGAVTVTVQVATAGLYPAARRATVLLKGNYPASEVRAVPVDFHLVQPTLRAQSGAGVRDWLNRPLAGDGGGGSCLLQLIDAGPDGLPAAPSADGSVGGDDALLRTYPGDLEFGRFGVGPGVLPDLGRFDEVFFHNFAVPGRKVYVRAWDAPTFAAAVAHGDSALHALSLAAEETRDFGSWLVNRAIGYPGIPGSGKDTNGDSVPDGYYIQLGMDLRWPIGPLAASWSNLASIGSQGAASNQMNFPTRLFLTDKFIFSLDRGNNRIQVWNRVTRAVARVYGSAGAGAGQFSQPYGMGKDPAANRFAIADTGNHRVQVFTFHPDTGAITFERQFGSYGTANGQMRNPYDAAIGPLGRIHVADTDNHRVQVFDTTGTFLFAFGSYGANNGQFKSPRGIAMDADGLIYVADTDNDRVQGFNGAGAFLWKLGTAGAGAGQFAKPAGLRVGLGSRLYVADTSNHRVQVFDAARNHVAGLGGLGSEKGQLRFPYDMEPATNSGVLYVADTWNHRIQELETVLDGDGDGMEDTWELLNDLDPTDSSDALIDTDGDLVLNIGEYRIRTHPRSADSDGDLMTDGEEIAAGTDPGDPSEFPLLDIASLARVPGFILRWYGSSGGVYRVEATSNLMSGGSWNMLPGSIFTSTVHGTVGFTNPLPDGHSLRFFRPVRVP